MWSYQFDCYPNNYALHRGLNVSCCFFEIQYNTVSKTLDSGQTKVR